MSGDLDEREAPCLGEEETSAKVLWQEYADVYEELRGGQCVWHRVTERRVRADEVREMRLAGDGGLGHARLYRPSGKVWLFL